MTEFPIAVTCRPDTFGSCPGAVRHTDPGASDTAAGDAEGPVTADPGLACGLPLTVPLTVL